MPPENENKNDRGTWDGVERRGRGRRLVDRRANERRMGERRRTDRRGGDRRRTDRREPDSAPYESKLWLTSEEISDLQEQIISILSKSDPSKNNR